MLLQTVNRPVQICRGVIAPAAGSGEQSPPGNGSTITIFDSTANANGRQFNVGLPFSRLVLSIQSSHNSGASGVIFEGSNDNGANWVALDAPAAATYTATAEAKYDIPVTMPQIRIRYTNSASVLTAWQMSLIGVLGDRSALT